MMEHSGSSDLQNITQIKKVKFRDVQIAVNSLNLIEINFVFNLKDIWNWNSGMVHR